MGLGDLFKSSKERKREERRSQRREERRISRSAEKKLRDLDGMIEKIREKRDNDWAKARDYLKNGQKAKAQDILRSCRQKEILASKLESKRDFWENRMVRLMAGKTDTDMVDTLKDLSEILNIDVEKIEDNMDLMNETIDSMTDVDKVIDDQYAQDMADVDRLQTESTPGLEDMFSELESEVAEEITSKSPNGTVTTESEGKNKAERIGKLRDRLDDILGEE